jgi:hypothetical protein
MWVISGYNGYNYLKTIEELDLKEKKWKTLNSQLNNGRSYFGSVGENEKLKLKKKKKLKKNDEKCCLS